MQVRTLNVNNAFITAYELSSNQFSQILLFIWMEALLLQCANMPDAGIISVSSELTCLPPQAFNSLKYPDQLRFLNVHHVIQEHTINYHSS